MADIQSILDFLGSNKGQAVSNFAGAGLSAYGQAQTAGANRKQTALQTAIEAIQNQYNNDKTHQLSQANSVLNNDPLGADQKFAQSQALMSAILPNVRNAHSTPGDPRVASAMGQHTGGIMNMIPQGGLDPTMINNLYGPTATMGSLVKHQNELANVNPNTPQANLTSMYGDQAAGPQAQIQQWASHMQTLDANQRSQFETQLHSYIDQMVKKEQDGNGFWHKFAKIAGIVGAGVATFMTAGGASPLLAGAVGTAAGAASSWGSGGNPLMGAIMGGASSYAGNKFGPKPGVSTPSIPNGGKPYGYNPTGSVI